MRGGVGVGVGSRSVVDVDRDLLGGGERDFALLADARLLSSSDELSACLARRP